MTHPLRQASVLAEFSCLGAECPDTCCQGWNMQLDAATHARYASQAPELLDAVTPYEGGFIMRRDAATDFCVKYEQGLCGIHRTRGTEFLGDACHFYPRVTRALGGTCAMTAAPSCPEVARLALAQPEPAALHEASAERLPHSLKNYLPEGVSETSAWAAHQAFLSAAVAEGTIDTVVARLHSAAHSLARLPQAEWGEAAPFFLRTADARLPAPEAVAEDPFNLLHALCGLVVSTHKTPSAALRRVVEQMEALLRARMDWQTGAIATQADSLAHYRSRVHAWQEHASSAEPLLKRWLQLQLSVALIPWAGFGTTLPERVAIIGIRVATLRLALIAAGPVPDAIAAAALAYPIARVLDHLADPAYSIKIYSETGWLREPRLRALLKA